MLNKLSVSINHPSITLGQKIHAYTIMVRLNHLNMIYLKTFVCQKCHEHKDQDQLNGKHWRQTMHQIFPTCGYEANKSGRFKNGHIIQVEKMG